MNDFLKVLLNIRSLRAAVRDLPFEQLEEIKQGSLQNSEFKVL